MTFVRALHTRFAALLSGNVRLLALLLVAAVLPLACSSIVIVGLYQNEWLFRLPMAHVLLGFILLSALLVGCALVPSTVVAILAGHYLQLTGLLAILISYPLAVVIGLLLGRFLVSILNIPPLVERVNYAAYVKALSQHELMFVAYLRLSPLLPFAMINVLLATLPVTWPRYIAGSVIGMLPRTLVFLWFGMNVEEVWGFVNNPSLEGAYSLVPIALILASLVGLLFVLRRVVSSVAIDKERPV